MTILVLNGVNLNMTGRREKGVYGTETLRDINDEIASYADRLGVTVKFFQNNLEGEICTAIQSAEGKYDGIILNAGAGFVVVTTGSIMRMPGLPKVPAAMNIDVVDDRITGLA